MNKLFILISGIFLLFGCTAADTGNSDNPSETAGNDAMIDDSVGDATDNGTIENQPDEIMENKYTMEEIAMHDNAEDCWLLVSGKVYDVTEFIAGGTHPGGDKILLGCGKDATSLFLERTTADGEKVGSGNPHSQNAQNYIETFYIGELA